MVRYRFEDDTLWIHELHDASLDHTHAKHFAQRHGALPDEPTVERMITNAVLQGQQTYLFDPIVSWSFSCTSSTSVF